MAVLLIAVLLFLIPVDAAYEDCQTPHQRPGKCVLLSHCPPFFEALQNRTSNISQDHIKDSHCGFESIFMPKVCCPIESVQLHNTKNALKCGLHTPDGETDPWIALIEYERANGKRAILCGGVLIHKKYILTTAHCVRGNHLPEGSKLVNVRFSESQVAEVEDVVVHENYDPDDSNRTNDVALVRLKKKVTAHRPICLPVGNGDKIGKKLLLAGWEKAGNDASKFIKRAGLATVWNNSECALVYGTTEVKLGENQMCAGGKKSPFVESYRVDIGGVLMEVASDSSFSVVGVMSIRPPCCDKEDYPKVYTKVSSYINWIFSNMDL